MAPPEGSLTPDDEGIEVPDDNEASTGGETGEEVEPPVEFS